MFSESIITTVQINQLISDIRGSLTDNIWVTIILIGFVISISAVMALVDNSTKGKIRGY